MKTGSRFAHILEKGSGKFISPVNVLLLLSPYVHGGSQLVDPFSY